MRYTGRHYNQESGVMRQATKPGTLKGRRERFVAEYLRDQSPADAYVRAGYRVASRRVARSAAQRLLTNVVVKTAIARAQAARRDLLDLDADGVVRRFHHLYLLAATTGDLSAAAVALQNVARLLGLYDGPKPASPRYTPADVDRLRAELRAAGFEIPPTPPRFDPENDPIQ